MSESRRRQTEQDRFLIGVLVLLVYGLLLLSPLAADLLGLTDGMRAVLRDAAQTMRDFAFLVVTYYFATSKGSSDKTELLAAASPPAPAKPEDAA